MILTIKPSCISSCIPDISFSHVSVRLSNNSHLTPQSESCWCQCAPVVVSSPLLLALSASALQCLKLSGEHMHRVSSPASACHLCPSLHRPPGNSSSNTIHTSSVLPLHLLSCGPMTLAELEAMCCSWQWWESAAFALFSVSEKKMCPGHWRCASLCLKRL